MLITRRFNRLNALSINGELYQIWDSTWIQSVWGTVEVVWDGTGFTCADYSHMAAQSNAYNAVLPYDIGSERLLGVYRGVLLDPFCGSGERPGLLR